MKRYPNVNGWKKKIRILRKRPVCFAAISFLLMISVFLLGRSYDEVLYGNETGQIFLEGKIAVKQYKESVYGNYWQIILKNVRVLREPDLLAEKHEAGEFFRKEENNVRIETLEGKYLCHISSGENVRLKIGQDIFLEGTYVLWEEPSNPGQFDTGKYYRSMGILGQFKKCKVLQQGEAYSLVREEMWRLRQKAQKYLEQELGEEDGAIVSAMILGEKSSLYEEDKNLYQRNGISHILTISGLHLMLLGSGVVKVLEVILGNRKRAAFPAVFIMLLYCVFTGSSISAIRATIMFALSLIAKIFGRSYDSLTALGVAAILQLFINPYVLNNSGFLLSFLAVIGVTFLAPRLQEILEAEKKLFKSACVSLSASMATLPVLLGNYGTYSWYSVILNLFILPPMPVLLFLAVMLTGVCLPVEYLYGEKITGTIEATMGTIVHCGNVTEFLFLGLKEAIVLGIKLILKYFEICCQLFEKIEFGEGYLGAPTVLQIVLYVCLLGVAISPVVKHSVLGRRMILLSAISILTLDLSFGIEVTMLDVGQGDSLVIQNSNGNIYLSDCGSTSVSKVGKYRLLPYLKQKGYGKIKGIFLSHLDEDHINGMIELLEMAPKEKIEIEYLFLPVSVLEIEEDREKVKELQKLAKQNETKAVCLTQGDKILDGNMEFVCLYPKTDKRSQVIRKDRTYEDISEKVKRDSGENRNNQSLVLYLKYRNFDMLLTGDVEKSGELEIAENIDQMSLDVLKVAHHGSSGSSCEELLEKIKPKLSLISCGKNNSYGHPHEETLERLKSAGSEVMTTVESGAITLKIGRKIRVYEFKKD